MDTIPAGFIPDEWNQLLGAFQRLAGQVIEIRSALEECKTLTADNCDFHHIRDQIERETDTLQFMVADANQRWKALGVSVASAVGRLGMSRPSDNIAWCSSILDTALTLYNGLRRELSGQDVQLCVQRLPLHLTRIPDDCSEWCDRVTAELRGGFFCQEPAPVVSGYAMTELKDMIGVEDNTTVGRYLNAANLPRAGRGQKKWALSHTDAIKFLKQVILHPNVPAHRVEAEKALRKLS